MPLWTAPCQRVFLWSQGLDVAFIVLLECRCRVNQAETIHPTRANDHPGQRLTNARRRLLPL